MADYSKMNYKELIAESKQLRAEEQARVAVMRAELNLSEAEFQTQVKKDATLKEINAKQNALLRVLKVQREQQKAITDDLVRQESSLKSLSAELQPLVAMERQRLELQRGHKDISAETAASFNNIADLNQQLANLSKDDVTSRAIIQSQIDEEIAALGEKEGVEKEILDNLRQQNGIAQAYGKLTEEQKDQLKAQVEAYNEIKKTIGGILGTAGLLFSGFRGFARITLFGAGQALTKLGKTTREMGGYLGGATISASALGTVFEDADGVAKGLSKEMGGLNDVTFANQLNTNLMATNMGISGDEAAKLTGTFARLNGNSIESAQNMAEGTKELAKQNGLVPAGVMADVAASAEEFALFGKEGGKNLQQAAVQAAKMGVSLKTMTGIADNLLDFESSINQEMELGAMLGKNINLDKARALAYEGDIAGATQETLNALGGVDAFNQMDYFSKKKTAELLGTSVEELQKMVTQQEEAATIGGKVDATFNTMTESLTALTTGPLGGFVSGLSGAIGTTKEIAGNLGDAGGFLKEMSGKVKAFFGGKKPEIPGQSTTPSTPAPQTQAGPADQASKMSKIKTTDLIKGAVALLILAAALFVAAKAFQEFGEVTWESVAMGLVALAGMAAIAFVLGKMSGQMIQGALAVAILGLALIPFAYALNMMSSVDANGLIASALALVVFTAAVFGLGALMMGPGAIVFGAGILALIALGGALMVFGAGLMLVGSGMAAITSALPAVVEQISALSTLNFLPIFGLAAALMALSVALAAVAATGLLALPALLALGLVAGGAAALMGGGEGEGENAKMDELIGEIKALRGDLLSGKIGVNMDGQKVTSKVSSVVSKVGSNSYAKV